MIALVAGLLGASVLLALVAFRRFPDPADRIVAADALSACAVGACLAASAYAEETAYLDVAIGFALVSFLATVGWSSAIVGRVPSVDTHAKQARPASIRPMKESEP